MRSMSDKSQAYYWKNREKILARSAARRRAKGQVVRGSPEHSEMVKELNRGRRRKSAITTTETAELETPIAYRPSIKLVKLDLKFDPALLLALGRLNASINRLTQEISDRFVIRQEAVSARLDQLLK